jgi:hypothetical protein
MEVLLAFLGNVDGQGSPVGPEQQTSSSASSPCWLTIAEAREIARRSEDAIHLWRKDRKIYARKRAGRWEFEHSSLIKHLEGRK